MVREKDNPHKGCYIRKIREIPNKSLNEAPKLLEKQE
jgi:hypothetical protein